MVHNTALEQKPYSITPRAVIHHNVTLQGTFVNVRWNQ